MSALLAAGMASAAAAEADGLLVRATRSLGRSPQWAWWVPGRLEVLGKHTDYAGGRALTCATDLGMVIAAAPCAERRVSIISGERRALLDLDDPRPRHGWEAYPAAVLRRLRRNFGPLESGADLALAANLPAAAGMSSSSTLMIAVASAMVALNRLSDRPTWQRSISEDLDLAGYLACMENGADFAALKGDGGVGTYGGSEDHVSIVLGRVDRLAQWRFAPTRCEAEASLPAGWCFVVADSGVVAEKTGAARDRYNACAQRAMAALAEWNRVSDRTDPTLHAAISVAGCEAVLATLSEADLRRRVEQFAVETFDLIPAARIAIAGGDLTTFAELAARSQALAESHLGNQVPETISLARLARSSGAIAASAFGAGFGGAVWALVEADAAKAFSISWAAAYHASHPKRTPGMHIVRPGPGLASLGCP